MQTAKRRQTMGATVASVIAHVAVLTVLALHSPVMRIPAEPPGPPQAIIPILLMPRALPTDAGKGGAPTPVRLHQRPPRFAVTDPNVAPIHVPEPQAPPTPPAAHAAVAPPPSAMPEGPRSDVRITLRNGLFGCANANAVNLTRAEREACDERLGRGAKDAPAFDPGTGLSSAKRALLDQAAAAKSAAVAGREAPLRAGTARPEQSDYDGDPYTSGAGVSAIGPVTHPPSKRAARQLAPLPP